MYCEISWLVNQTEKLIKEWLKNLLRYDIVKNGYMKKIEENKCLYIWFIYHNNGKLIDRKFTILFLDTFV